jgi:hypothetical protein
MLMKVSTASAYQLAAGTFDEDGLLAANATVPSSSSDRDLSSIRLPIYVLVNRRAQMTGRTGAHCRRNRESRSLDDRRSQSSLQNNLGPRYRRPGIIAPGADA